MPELLDEVKVAISSGTLKKLITVYTKLDLLKKSWVPSQNCSKNFNSVHNSLVKLLYFIFFNSLINTIVYQQESVILFFQIKM